MSRRAGTYPHYLYVGDVFRREKLAGITGFCGKCPGAAMSGPRSRERRPPARGQGGQQEPARVRPSRGNLVGETGL